MELTNENHPDRRNTSKSSILIVNDIHDEDVDIGPLSDLEFESHEAAYKFYQEYAKSVGFITSIKNSRRSKKSKDFIDAKFACSRYGVTPESDTSGTSGTRRCSTVKKTDCKASMHVKRNKSGKWTVHEFIKEHNHELLPALSYHFQNRRDIKLAEKNNFDILNAVSEHTKKLYVEMSRQCTSLRILGSLRDQVGCEYDTGNCLPFDEGDAQILLDYLMRVKKENPTFFYAIDFNEENRLRNIFWVDAKSRSDYPSFSDVVSLDTCIKINDKVPVVLLISVNHHFQPMLLGCALISEDDSSSSLFWVMKTWVRAMGGKAPNVIITGQHPSMNATIAETLPGTRHCFYLWCVLERIQEKLERVIQRHENFTTKFQKCVFKSWTEEQFEFRWWKMVSRFDLEEDEWVRSLFDDRKKWVPLYTAGAFFAGMSTTHRGESVNSFFDRYFHRKQPVRELVKQYGLIVQNRHVDEAAADFDTWHKHPALKSPSPWEKQMSTIYTHAIFRKFQVEVLGVVGCHPKKEGQDGTITTYRVEDCEKNEPFFVSWDESKSEVSCICRSFEYRGFLCRHAMIVLQICGISSIPGRYILRRWTKDAKSREVKFEGIERGQTRAQRYVAVSKLAIELSEEGSLTQERYNRALQVLAKTLKHCIHINNANNSVTDVGKDSYGSLVVGGNPKIKKKNSFKKRKVPSEADITLADEESMHQMETMSSGGISLNGYYGSQPNVQGLLNLMDPPNENYYLDQESIPGLGDLNSSREGLFGTHESAPGNLDFRPSSSFSYSLQDEHSMRSPQIHGDVEREG